MLAAKRPDVQIVGDELHPLLKVTDFSPYIAKIKASGADSVVTGNWGQDIALLLKAAALPDYAPLIADSIQWARAQAPAAHAGKTAALAAVVEVFSLMSIESLVDRIVEPASFMSMMIVAPVGAVVTLARTALRVKA